MAEIESDKIQEPTKSAEWLALIEDAEKYFRDYFDSCDAIDRTYANLNDLRSGMRDQEFQLFWSNIAVMGPSVYARPPQPVVTPRFKDRRPLYRVASEMLERVSSTAFDMADVNDVLLQVRDDLVINGRGVSWVRYDDEDGKRVCIDHIDRRDFLHEPARKWADVSWVARRGWLTYSEMEDRFGKDVADKVAYQVQDKDNRFGPQDCTRKCGVWEIWSKREDKVVWVTPGVEDVLDEGAPHLNVEGFFPCPQPAYATVQRRSLIPIADVVYYKGQLDQINDLTARIHALGNAIRMKGFYQGGGEIGDAVEAAYNAEDDGRIMVPVSSMAAFGSGADPVIWLPIDQIAATLTALVELRRQLIEDVYQIVGLSDIMRGMTDADETLGAQQLKQQNGSYRVRDKQNEIVRMARDLVRISAEIIAENFDRKTLEDMAQMDIPSKADIRKQVKPLEDEAKEINRQLKEASEDPETRAMAQQNPEAAQKAIGEAQQRLQGLAGQIEELQAQPTIEDVLDFLKDNKLRPFVLDIETDSTIYPDEMREKASRAEFMQVFSTVMAGVSQLAQLGPQAIGLSGGVLKFALAPYRVGRELEGLIDDFVDAAPQIAEQMAAQQASGEGEEQTQAMLQIAQAEAKSADAKARKVDADASLKMFELHQKQEASAEQSRQDAQRFELEVADTRGKLAETDARIEKIYAEIKKLGIDAEVSVSKEQRETVKTAADIQGQAQDRQMAQRQQVVGEAQAQRADMRADRQQSLAERQPPKG